jgi:hypothetical protein
VWLLIGVRLATSVIRADNPILLVTLILAGVLLQDVIFRRTGRRRPTCPTPAMRCSDYRANRLVLLVGPFLAVFMRHARRFLRKRMQRADAGQPAGALIRCRRKNAEVQHMDRYVNTLDSEWYRQRIVGASIYALVAFVALFVRLIYLQVVLGRNTSGFRSTTASGSRSSTRPGVDPGPQRHELAENRPSFDVSFTPKDAGDTGRCSGTFVHLEILPTTCSAG